MRGRFVMLAAAWLALAASSAQAQDRVRVFAGGGQQVTAATFEQSATFQQYFEQGSLKAERTIPKAPFFDVGAAVRLAGGLHAGVTMSFFTDNGAGTVTAQVPHPFFFNQPRTVTSEVPGITRKETAAHIQALWTAPAAGGLELTFFGGPSVFMTEQRYVKGFNLSLASEVYPYDALALPGASTGTFKETIVGYNAGVDLTWRVAPHVGLGILIRHSRGTETVTPAGAQPARVEVGGLHAGGGIRLIF